MLNRTRVRDKVFTGHRYVSQHSTHRAYCLVAVVVFLCTSLNAADWKPNTKARTILDTALLELPQEGSATIGSLPSGTIVTLVGNKQTFYLLVEVELQGEEVVEGWVNENSLAPLEPGLRNEKTQAKKEEKKKLKIPQDEILLVRREPSFFYGAQIGSNFAIIENEANLDRHTGLGLLGGAQVGMFLKPNIPVRLELNYSQFTGFVAGAAPELMDFGLMEVAVLPSYLIGDLELFGGLQYVFGLSVGDIPAAINSTFNGTSDLSGIWGQFGVGYGFSLGTLTRLTVRLRYAISFNRSPFFFQGPSLLVGIALFG